MALTIEGLEKWYLNTVKLKHAFAGTTPPEPIPLPSVTTIDGLLEGIVGEAENAFVAAADYSGHHHTYDTAYKLTLPDKLYRWYGVKKVGGKTIIMNQIQANTTTRTNNGVVFTYDSTNGTLTISEETPGATRGSAGYWLAGASATKWVWNSAHKYLIRFNETMASNIYAIATGGSNLTINNAEYKFVSNKSGEGYVNVVVGTSKDLSTPVVLKPVVYDLTLMFGAGNEPTTIDAFEAVFPADFYPYNTGTLLNVGVKDIVFEDGGTVKESYTVPAEVQALAGYGMSCPSGTNYIDFEGKKFYQYVGTRAYASGDESDATVITDGTNTNYKLDAAVETDISAYLTELPDADVQSGWDIFFKYDDNYRVPVPVQVDYIGV